VILSGRSFLTVSSMVSRPAQIAEALRALT
jgi:hypothetical protein